MPGEIWLVCHFFMSVSMNPIIWNLVPNSLVPCKHLPSVILRREWDKILPEVRGCKKSLHKGGPHFYKIQLRLKGQEALLAEILEEEMAHQMQVSALSHLHLWQAEEIKAQSEEIKWLSTLLERQQTIMEQVQKQQSSVSQMPWVQQPTSWLDELQKEAFNILPGTINARHGNGIQYLSSLSQNILATWGSQHPCHVNFASGQKGTLTCTPLRSLAKVGEDNILLPQQRRARESLVNPVMCPPR